MNATVCITLEVVKEYLIPNVNSVEEAEAAALELVEDEFEDNEYEIVSLDTFEANEMEIN